jgi:hypothetical protein
MNYRGYRSSGLYPFFILMIIPVHFLTPDIESAKVRAIYLNLYNLFGSQTSLPDRTIMNLIEVKRASWYKYKSVLLKAEVLREDAGVLYIEPIDTKTATCVEVQATTVCYKRLLAVYIQYKMNKRRIAHSKMLCKSANVNIRSTQSKNRNLFEMVKAVAINTFQGDLFHTDVANMFGIKRKGASKLMSRLKPFINMERQKSKKANLSTFNTGLVEPDDEHLLYYNRVKSDLIKYEQHYFKNHSGKTYDDFVYWLCFYRDKYELKGRFREVVVTDNDAVVYQEVYDLYDKKSKVKNRQQETRRTVIAENMRFLEACVRNKKLFIVLDQKDRWGNWNEGKPKPLTTAKLKSILYRLDNH